jgi:regulator of protease activity HflC (stomatin/prohibitin superfamily)
MTALRERLQRAKKPSVNYPETGRFETFHSRKEAAFRDAEARERLAEAEAMATDAVSAALARGNVQALNYFIADKYIKAFAEFAHSPNQKILMMPIEATNILGSLAGIAKFWQIYAQRQG